MKIDCQTPGWLSSKIAYGDQMTLKNLTVTGYLNGTDIVFLKGLLFDKSLKHLDLTDAHIVAGGRYAPQNDVLLSGSFYNSNRDTISFLALPSSLKEIDGTIYGSTNYSTKGICSPVDSLFIGGSLSMIPQGVLRQEDEYGYSHCPKYLYIREGTDSIERNINFVDGQEIHLPSTIKSLGRNTFYSVNSHSDKSLDINLEYLTYIDHCAFAHIFLGDTIRLPENLKTWYTCSFCIKDGTTIYIPKNISLIDNRCMRDGNHYLADNQLGSNKALDIYVESTTPIFVKCDYGSNGMAKAMLNKCIVHVPAGCSTAYKNEDYFGKDTVNPWAFAKEIVEENIPVTGISLDKSTINLSEIGSSVQLKAIVKPEDASNKSIVWNSSDSKVAMVINGKVICVGLGTAVVSAVTEDGGFIATCVVNSTTGMNNPFTDEHIRINNRVITFCDLTPRSTIKVCDISGKVVFSASNGEKTIRTQQLPKGIYLIVIDGICYKISL